MQGTHVLPPMSHVRDAERNSLESTGSAVRLDVHLQGADARRDLCTDVRRGLGSDPKWLSPRWFYDDRGSQLFSAITRLPEYYPYRCEAAILSEQAEAIAAAVPVTTLVELGSGTCEKTRPLLDALMGHGLRRFVPFDVSIATLHEAAVVVGAEYPDLAVHAIAGDFQRHLAELPGGDRQMVALLGGTIGNLLPGDRAKFLSTLAAQMAPGDGLLLGTDLVKDPGRLVAAYDDSTGVTAAFNRNVLRVLNRELGANFEPESFHHVARWDAEQEWIEMHLQADTDQHVYLPEAQLSVEFRRNETLRTEVSAKFRREGLATELDAAGFDLRHWWTDAAGDYALSLSIRSGQRGPAHLEET